MPVMDADRFLFTGSPFLPELSPETLERIGGACSPFEPLWFTVATGLLQEADGLARSLLSQSAALYEQFGTVPPDLALYHLGFVAPLRMLTVGYQAIFTDDASAASQVPYSNQPPVERFNQYLRLHTRALRILVGEQPSGGMIFTCAEEQPFFSGSYYRVGVRAARLTFEEYTWAFGARRVETHEVGGVHG